MNSKNETIHLYSKVRKCAIHSVILESLNYSGDSYNLDGIVYQRIGNKITITPSNTTDTQDFSMECRHTHRRQPTEVIFNVPDTYHGDVRAYDLSVPLSGPLSQLGQSTQLSSASFELQGCAVRTTIEHDTPSLSMLLPYLHSAELPLMEHEVCRAYTLCNIDKSIRLSFEMLDHSSIRVELYLDRKALDQSSARADGLQSMLKSLLQSVMIYRDEHPNQESSKDRHLRFIAITAAQTNTPVEELARLWLNVSGVTSTRKIKKLQNSLKVFSKYIQTIPLPDLLSDSAPEPAAQK